MFFKKVVDKKHRVWYYLHRLEKSHAEDSRCPKGVKCKLPAEEREVKSECFDFLFSGISGDFLSPKICKEE